MIKHPPLYILRHGQTQWNLAGKFQGRQDSELTQLGKQQAQYQGKLLSKIKPKSTDIYCSPQGRAMSTAELALGSLEEVRVDERLQEIDFGDWEGLTLDEIKAQINYSIADGTWSFRSPKGESYAEICERLQGFVSELTEPAIIFTHGTTAMVLRGLCLGLSQTETLKLDKEQGCIYQVANGLEKTIR